jgi:hypothetical protein
MLRRRVARSVLTCVGLVRLPGRVVLARAATTWYRETRPMSRLLLILATTLVAGCGAARVISRTGTGGVLVLEGFRDRARDDAHRQMTVHCRGQYTIVREGDAVAGQATEFRVRYVCGEVPGVPPNQYERPMMPLEGIPDANRIGLD